MYPGFVQGAATVDIIPVFYYHRVDPAQFRKHLQHLRRNGYRTLTGDELYDRLQTEQAVAAKDVVLTFDDGLDDVYTAVYPLLREFGAHAVLFIVPGWIGRAGFLTWKQIREMHASGLVDVQSHSMHHQSIFTTPQIVDFYSPQFSYHSVWDLPIVNTNGTPFRLPAYGTPLYPSCSRLADTQRYIPDDLVRERCVEYVNTQGDAAFFRKPNWRRQLEQVATAYAVDGVYESDADRNAAIRAEVVTAQATIAEQVPGTLVRHFSFPWHERGTVVEQVLRDAGYRTMSVGLTQPYRHTPLGTAFRTARVNGDFVPTLPGAGRQPFWRILLLKAYRKICSQTVYQESQPRE